MNKLDQDEEQYIEQMAESFSRLAKTRRRKYVVNLVDYTPIERHLFRDGEDSLTIWVSSGIENGPRLTRVKQSDDVLSRVVWGAMGEGGQEWERPALLMLSAIDGSWNASGGESYFGDPEFSHPLCLDYCTDIPAFLKAILGGEITYTRLAGGTEFTVIFRDQVEAHYDDMSQIWSIRGPIIVTPREIDHLTIGIDPFSDSDLFDDKNNE